MSALTHDLCLEAAKVSTSATLKLLYSIRIVLGIVGIVCVMILVVKKGSSWIPHPNGKLLYKAHLYFAFHVSGFFTFMYIYQLVRSSMPSDDPCFYAIDARLACLIRIIPGVGIHFQSFNMFTFAVERAISTLYPTQYEKISKPYVGILLISLTLCAAIGMDYFAMLYPIPAGLYVSVLTSKNSQNLSTYGIINYVPFVVEFTTITVFVVTYRQNLRKSRQLEMNSNALGDRYQISENKKVIRILLPCFLCHFCLNIFSYGILALIPMFTTFDLVTNLIWVECISQAQTYSVVLPMIVFWQSRLTPQHQVQPAEKVTDLYFQQLADMWASA